MSMYNDASLALIPSAVGDGVVYNARPVEVLGAELVTNGDFSNGYVGWGLAGNPSNYSIEVVSYDGKTNALHFTTTSASEGVNQNVLQGNKLYKVKFDLRVISGSIYAGSSSSKVTGGNLSPSTWTTYQVDWTSSDTYFRFYSTGAAEFYIDNVSVKETSAQDFDFTRASEATRVLSGGRIEKVRTNVLTYSNDFSNAVWSKGDVTISANATISPDGQLNAYKITDNTNAARHRISRAVTLSGSTVVYTSSVFFKAGTHRYAFLNTSAGSNIYTIVVDLQTGSKTNETGSGIDFKVTNFGSGWYRLSVTITAASATAYIQFGAAGSATPTYNNYIPTYAGSSEHIFGFGAQLEYGLVSTQYIETTSAAVSVGPVANMPRLDWSGGTPSLLLEPSRTNLAPYSEAISQWTLAFATLTSNDAISPDGYQNADKIVTSSSGCDVKYTSVTVAASTTYTASFWVKLTSGTGLQTRFYDNTNGANIEYYTYDSQLTTGEWSRVTRTFTTPAGCTNIQVWYLAASSSSSVTAHFWGYQLEAGNHETSYIPSYGTATTRAVDACANAGDSATFNDSEGVLFAEISRQEGSVATTAWSVNNGALANSVNVYFYGTDTLYFDIFSGVATVSGDVTVNTYNVNKIALKYKSGDISMYVNGSKVLTKTSAISLSGLVDLDFNFGAGNQPFYGNVNQLLYFPTALSDTELEKLTTL